MFLEERHQAILNLLNQHGKVMVKDLSLQFNVSDSMIRKDLQFLEKEGKLKRTYGGALKIERPLVEGAYFAQRVKVNTKIKEAIAQKAFQRIHEHDVVFLDVSSTAFILAKMLVNSEKVITIITNMPIISSLISPASQQRFFFIGGDYNLRVGGTIGASAIEHVLTYRCNKAFIGCSGADISDGSITVSNTEDAHTKKAILQIAKEPYLFIPSDYLEKDGLITFSNIADYRGIIIEDTPNSQMMNKLRQYDVDIY